MTAARIARGKAPRLTRRSSAGDDPARLVAPHPRLIAAVKQQLDALSAHPANPGRPARSRPRAVLLAQITIPPMLAAVKSP